MKTLKIVTLMLLLITSKNVFAHNGCHEEAEAVITSNPILTNIGDVRALVIFASFNDRPQGELPSWAGDIFNPDVPNSLSHYYNVQSHGKHNISGDVVDRWIYSKYNRQTAPEKCKFVRSILEQVDEDIDFALYDNWNAMNEQKSDGKVDIVFINIADNPWQSNASLNLKDYPFYYETNDTVAGKKVRIYSYCGTTQGFNSEFEFQMGIMAHEYGHILGLIDLYDLSYFNSNSAPEDYSAGIGYWGLMSEGYGTRGLYSLSEHCKAELAWVDVVEISSNSFDVHVEPGTVYKVKPHAFDDDEYFMITYRDHSNFYDQKLPSGMFIWHIDEEGLNTNERHKLIDLECADGLFDDRGFPGDIPNPISGGDNLDYWSKHHSDYTSAHHGNTFDGTDPFDGIQFRSFTPYSNPNSNGYSETDPEQQSKVSRLAITNIRPGGWCDVIFNYWKGRLLKDTTWDLTDGGYYLDDDITVPAGVTLTIKAGVDIAYNGYSIYSTGGEVIWEDIQTSVDRGSFDNENQQQSTSFKLAQNYPNPFNPSTTIRYDVFEPTHVVLKVINTAGQEVRTLVDQFQSAGVASVMWDGRDNAGQLVSTGVYMCRLETINEYQGIKMLLRK